MKSAIIALVTSVILVSGCSNKAVESHEYLLRPAGTVVPYDVNASPTLELHTVRIADYLDREGLILESSDNQIQAARYHRWAEPLRGSLKRYLQVAISQRTGISVAADLQQGSGADVRIDVIVHQLHGGAGGDVRMVAEWQLSNGKRHANVLMRSEFADTVRISADGYSAVVDAHEQLLDALAEAVADGIGRLEKTSLD